jgi:hypothetical protein
MSYALEELRAGIVELFDDVADMSRYKVEFGTLPSVVFLRGWVRKKARAAPVRREVNAPLPAHAPREWRSKLVCFRCGARASLHRCPG